MKRYGDNISCEDLLDPSSENGNARHTIVFLGGCSANHGPMRVQPRDLQNNVKPKKNVWAKLLSFLKLQRDKTLK